MHARPTSTGTSTTTPADRAATGSRTLTGMTFSITADGDRDETLRSLAKVTHADELGQWAADLLIKAIGSGPDELLDGRRPHYSASAFGHYAVPGGALPSLSISLGVTYVPIPGQRGGIEVDPDPTDIR